MHRVIQVSLLIIALILLINSGLAWLLNGQPALAATGGASTASFLLLLPLGMLLINLSAIRPDHQDTGVVGSALTVWGVAVLAYFGAGFAFQFGGLAIGNDHVDFAELYWNWSPLETADAQYWGVIGLRGWALLGAAGTAGIYDLFLRHMALLGVVVIIPACALHQRVGMMGLLLLGGLSGGILYPLAGNWVWSSGWLSYLGQTMQLGHGFIDAGLATPFALAGLITLGLLIVFPKEPEPPRTEPTPMPPEYLPYISLFGLTMIIWGWTFIAQADHLPTAGPVVVPRTALNGLLAMAAGGLLAALYSRFVTAQFNLLMLVRGAVASLVALSTVAPFIVPWQAVVIGVGVGVMIPFLVYFVDHTLHLPDHTAAVAMFGLMGFLAWLFPGILADGTVGVGWNGVGESQYLGIEGQGVSGLFVTPGYQADWPGQFNAQVIGATALTAWAFGLTYLVFRSYRALAVGLSQVAEKARTSSTESEPSIVQPPFNS